MSRISRIARIASAIAAFAFAAVVALAACDDEDEPPPRAAAYTREIESPPTAAPTPIATPTVVPTATPTPTPAPAPRWHMADYPTPPDRDLIELAVRLRGAPPSATAVATSAPLVEGARETFAIHNLDDATTREIIATLRLVSENAYWFVDDAVSVDQADLERVADGYERRVRPRLVETFGDIRSPGIDGDPRIVILHTSIVGAGGYFSSGDSYPAYAHPHSNEREIIYIDGESFPMRRGDLYLTVLAHELQHAIHFEGDAGEDSWVNEGLSELATEIAGYRVFSPPYFDARPATQLDFWSRDPDESAAHYGASARFFAYLLHRIGGDERRSELRELVSQPLDGIAGVDAFLQERGLRWIDVFADWVVANYLDADDDERYGYPNHDVSVRASGAFGQGRAYRFQAPQFSARYHRLIAAESEGAITFSGDADVELAQTECLRAPVCWFGGRGDEIDTRLTREIDLTALDTATLEFDIWHDIEESWDYAYVQASADGGRTWDILAGKHTTTDNPSGQAYGPGYTGESGGWLSESIDLSAYAGGKVLTRFEYVTDDAIYQDGLLIDGVTIAETGYEYGDDGGWTKEGFDMRTTRLPQRFIVQILRIAADGSHTVTQLPLDADNRAEIRLTALDDGGETIVIVSPTTAGTRHPAGYELRFVE